MVKKSVNRFIAVLVIALCASVLGLWVFRDLPCPIRTLTGLPCPGCGMSRAWQAFFRLDIRQALRCHPMFWSVPVVALFALWDFSPLPKKWQNHWILGLITAGVLILYLIRLILFLQGRLEL